MALYRMDTLLRQARSRKTAVGAFECWDLLNMHGIALAASYTHSPVIFQASAAESNTMGGAQILADIARYFIRKYDIDAAIHLDHGATLREVRECLDAGYSSVMLDASTRPFDENAAICAVAAELAHHANASFEAELGHVGGGDGGVGSQSVFTVPAEAADFVAKTQTDCLAVAIGTVHGDYKGTPSLQLELLKQIAATVDVPLVLHGGSGTPIPLLQQAIELGINKINICTDINKAYIAAIEDAHTKLTPSVPGRFYKPAVEALAQKTAALIRLFNRE